MTEFHYAKRGSAYGGVMYGKKTLIVHFSRNFDTCIFVTKITDLNSNTSICWNARVASRVMKLGN